MQTKLYKLLEICDFTPLPIMDLNNIICFYLPIDEFELLITDSKFIDMWIKQQYPYVRQVEEKTFSSIHIEETTYSTYVGELLHSLFDKPAVIIERRLPTTDIKKQSLHNFDFNYKEDFYYKRGIYHRDEKNGPAQIGYYSKEGKHIYTNYVYLLEGYCHRINGPAKVFHSLCRNGSIESIKYYYRNNIQYNEDGSLFDIYNDDDANDGIYN